MTTERLRVRERFSDLGFTASLISRLHAPSLSVWLTQFLRQNAQEERRGCVTKKVVAREHLKREGSGGLVAPCFEALTTDFMIL